MATGVHDAGLLGPGEATRDVGERFWVRCNQTWRPIPNYMSSLNRLEYYCIGAISMNAEVDAEAIVVNSSGLRRSARLRKLKEDKGKVLSQYFSEPTQSSAQIRRISKKGKRKLRDQSRYVFDVN